MRAKSPRKPCDEIYPKALFILTKKEVNKTFQRLLQNHVFAQAFEAAFIQATPEALEKAVTFEEAFTLAYKDALKETLWHYF